MTDEIDQGAEFLKYEQWATDDRSWWVSCANGDQIPLGPDFEHTYTDPRTARARDYVQSDRAKKARQEKRRREDEERTPTSCTCFQCAPCSWCLEQPCEDEESNKVEAGEGGKHGGEEKALSCSEMPSPATRCHHHQPAEVIRGEVAEGKRPYKHGSIEHGSWRHMTMALLVEKEDADSYSAAMDGLEATLRSQLLITKNVPCCPIHDEPISLIWKRDDWRSVGYWVCLPCEDAGS